MNKTSELIVSKFGGSSVKDASAMLRCSQIIEMNSKRKVVVISATQNTTNQLETVAKEAAKKDRDALTKILSELIHKHTEQSKELFTSPTVISEMDALFTELNLLASEIFEQGEYSNSQMDQLYSIGERLSSAMFADLLRLRMPEKKIHLIDARKIIKTNSEFKKAEPQISQIKEAADRDLLPLLSLDEIIVTQGFIGSDSLGRTTTLGREGSDYSAALLGEALSASKIEIWTDVSGIASADPRLITEAKYIDHLSYDEATALATLGAKVLFPTTLMPAKRNQITVFVGSSLNHEATGTLITNDIIHEAKIKAVTISENESGAYLSFVGSHLDNLKDLVFEIENQLSLFKIKLYAQNSLSLSFKISTQDKGEILKEAHKIFIS